MGWRQLKEKDGTPLESGKGFALIALAYTLPAAGVFTLLMILPKLIQEDDTPKQKNYATAAPLPPRPPPTRTTPPIAAPAVTAPAAVIPPPPARVQPAPTSKVQPPPPSRAVTPPPPARTTPPAAAHADSASAGAHNSAASAQTIMKARRKHPRATLPLAGLSFVIVCPFAKAATDQHFDYTSFETGFQQPHLDVLNYPSINGNYMMTSTDNHRPEMVANNNVLAEFYNNFNADYNHPTAERRTPTEEAAFINTYTLNNSTNNGVRPQWLVLNEISSSQWQLNPGVPSLSEHRTWVIDTVTLLNDTYGYKVITYSPYETVGTANAAPGRRWRRSRTLASSPIRAARKFGTAAAITHHASRGRKASIKVRKAPT
jgi:hypothetical protein